MVWVSGGTFLMGLEDFYPEERPVREVAVDGFHIDCYAVTNRQFSEFTKDTEYVTIAERPLTPENFPGAPMENLVPGSMVFQKTSGPVDLRNYGNWWAWTPGASWRHPRGPHSSIAGMDDHPVVHIAFEDAEAYARWAGKDLPTEAQWEYAARGGLEGAKFTWGNEHSPGGMVMANTWRGEFPWHRMLINGYEATCPVGLFPANAYGLYDMAGNVWEWTSDWYVPRPPEDAVKSCCGPPDESHLVSPERATIPRSRSFAFRARWSRADLICAHPITVCATGQLPAGRRWSTPG